MEDIRYEQILVPHGGTRAGDIALNHAVAIAKKFSSTITLLHVVIPVPSVYSLSLMDDQKEEFVTEAVEITDSIVKKMKEDLKKKSRAHNGEIKIDIQVLEGDPAHEIIEYAKQHKMNLIIMPRRRLTGLKSLLKIGSISRKVIEHASCPVMLLDEY